MICGSCGKREAEFLIKQIINQEVHNLNLCRVCAERMGFISPDTPSITISFSLSDAEPAKQKKKKNFARQRREELENALVCSACGTTFGTFRETKLLGCAKCYEAFRFPLGAYLQEQQGAESHWGGMSGTFSDIALARGTHAVTPDELKNARCEEIDRIRAEIDEAVRCEEYEHAAELRDILRPLLANKTDGGDDV
jgi:protein arginine kinase activator